MEVCRERHLYGAVFVGVRCELPDLGDYERNNNRDQIAAASKQGNGTLLQIFVGTAPVSGHVPVFDVNGNIIDSGAAPGTGTGGGVGTGFTVSVDGVATGLTGLGAAVAPFILTRS